MHQAKPGVVSLAALSLLDGSVEGAPDWAVRFLSGTLRSLTSYLGGTHFLEGLYLEERGSLIGRGVSLGMVKCWNFILHLPKGEAMLYRIGKRGLGKRYKRMGHSYGVKIRDEKDIKEALERQKQRIQAKAN